MSDMIIYPHLEISPDTVNPHIAGRQLTVKFLTIFLNDSEWPVERICEQYALTPAQVYSAWAYYYDHKEVIDNAIAEDNEAYDQLVHDPVRLAKIDSIKQRKLNRGA